MQPIDPNDPIYKGMTKRELQKLKHFTTEEKEALSQQLFKEALFAAPDWKKQAAARWSALLGEAPSVGHPYRISHQDLLSRANASRLFYESRQNASHHPQPPRIPTVSAFSDWLLRLYNAEKDSTALLSGQVGERAVVDYRRILARQKREIPRWENAGWRLIHDGIRGEADEGYEIPTLSLNGVSMRGRPDLVFRERKSGKVLVVELKVSSAALPSDGWPNLRAQLWAYARISRWFNEAKEILLAGEVWNCDGGTPIRRTT